MRQVNNKKRTLLKDVQSLLSKSMEKLSMVLEDEENCLDNIPENLQDSDNYERMEEAIGRLESAIESIESAQDDINEASL